MATRYNYTGQLITDGLVLNLDAAKRDSYPGSGTTWYDLSGNGNNGTLTNGPTYTGVSKDAAIVFDGVDDYVDCGNNSNLDKINNGFSINCWISPTDLTNTYTQQVLGKRESSSPNQGYELFYNVHTDNTIRLLLDFGSSVVQVSSSVALVTGSWTNTNFTVVDNNLTCFINGSPSNTVLDGNLTGTTSNTTPLTLGKDGREAFNVDYFKGKIATSQIYNRALTQFEVFQNFNALKGRYGIPDIVTDGLVLNLDAGNPYSYLSGSSGTTWTDISGEGNNGTLTNGASYENGAIVFDGVDDYVNLGNNFSFNSSFSLEVWVKNTNQGVDGLITKDDVSGNREWNFHITSATPNPYSLRFRINGVDTVDGTTVIGNDNTWHQCVAVYNGSQMLIYLDTVLDNSKNVSGTPTTNTSAECQIGNFDGNVYPYNGNISITRIYNRALSQTEITQNFNALRGRYGI